MDQTVIDIIADIYSAASSPEEWPRVATRIQQLIGGHSVYLALSDSQRHRVDCLYSNGLSKDDVRFYHENIAENDPLTAMLTALQPGTAFLLEDHITQEQLFELPEYQTFYDRVGVNNFAGSYFYQNQATHGWCAVSRSKEDPPFNIEQRELLEQLTPHLGRATHISLQLSSVERIKRLAQETLEMLPMGIGLITSHNEVVGHNSRIQRFLARPRQGSRYELTLPYPDAQQQFIQALRALQANPHNPPSQCLTFDFDQRQITVVLAPWVSSESQREWLPEDACAMVLINDPAYATQIPMEWLIERYGLSKAEARVLMQVLAGKAAAEIAESLFVTTHTVRFHIKNLLLKVECSSQTQMVATVLKAFSGLY